MPFITLRNGPTLPVDALKLAWSLEDRGFTVTPTARGVHVSGTDTLTDEDRAAIKAFKFHLSAIHTYEP